MAAVDPFLERIPETLQEQYLLESVAELLKLKPPSAFELVNKWNCVQNDLFKSIYFKLINEIKPTLTLLLSH